MDDASIIEMFRQRDEQAIYEIKRKYDKICFYIAGNILSQHEDVEECVNSANLIPVFLQEKITLSSLL